MDKSCGNARLSNGQAMKYVMHVIQNAAVELLNHLKMFGAENRFHT